MSGLNRVDLVGFMGSDPELKWTPGGRALCNIRLATDESYTDKTTGKKVEKTEWHRIVVWGKKAETAAQFLSKGRQIFVTGKLQTRSYDKDGQKHFSTEVVSNRIIFLGGGRTKSDNVAEGTVIESGEETGESQSVSEMEIPV